ncbi:MAG: hypothetical protein AAB600_04615 [Patescibacteria group bacterium]
MQDFKLLQNPISKKWIILAPRRANRPDVAKGAEPICPFCLGKERSEKEVYRVGGKAGDSNWQIRVIPNKFPFAPIHEIIIHSGDHHKNFGELPLNQVELIFKTYRQRYNIHQSKGQVYIFHNRGESGGESLPHPHTQLAVVPNEVKMDMPRLATNEELKMLSQAQPDQHDKIQQETKHFILFCPKTSQWPDEVWIAPKKRGRGYNEITDEEIVDLSYIVTRVVGIFNLRHGYEFPFNFYIYPGGDWYLRIIPRAKVLGGFEIGTGIFINTQDPMETIMFIKEHFESPNKEKIMTHHRAEYRKGV